MQTAIVVLATDEKHLLGTEVLFHSLKKYGNFPPNITLIVMGQESCNFAEAVPITIDYSWIPSVNTYGHTRIKQTINKFFALTLPFDKIILLDADIMCVGDCSYLWFKETDSFSIYAAPDTASKLQYDLMGLDGENIFSSGTSIHNRPNECDIVQQIKDGNCHSYDGGDQGYFNYYYQKIKPNQWGILPSEYNQCLDKNMPQIEDKRLIHFTGAKPWDGCTDNSWYMQWHQLRRELR